MKTKSIKFFFAFLSIIMLAAIYAPSAVADNGDIDVEVVINSFGGGQPMYDLKVKLFNTSQSTGYDGKAAFQVKGPPQDVTDLLEIYDSSDTTCYGRATVNFTFAPNINYAIHPDNNPGIFTLDIEYTDATDAIIINAELSQSLDIEILSIDFVQNPNTNNQQQPQNQQPPQDQPPQEFHGDDPDMPGGDRGFDLGMSPLTIGLIIAVVILVVVVIVLLVRNARKKG